MVSTLSRLNEFAPQFERALREAGGTHTIEDLAKLIDEQKVKLWDGGDSLILTEIYEFPQKTVLNFWIAVGRRPTLLKMQRYICSYAITQGVDSAIFTGRRGWGRTELMDGEGWAPVLTQFRKEIS